MTSDRNRSKFLNYWWLSDSEIDPKTAIEDYFRVTYDNRGRYVNVEKYDVQHQLKSYTRFHWNNKRIKKVEAFGGDGKLQRYSIYRYRWGKLLGTDDFSADGKILRFTKNDDT